MIEHSAFEHNVHDGTVWHSKENSALLVCIKRVWPQRQDDGTYKTLVGVYLWDVAKQHPNDAWINGRVMSRDDFEAEFEYSVHHFMNDERETRRTAYLADRALSQLLDLAEDREKALNLMTAYTMLVRRRAGYEVLASVEDDKEIAGAELVDSGELSAEQIEELMSND